MEYNTEFKKLHLFPDRLNQTPRDRLLLVTSAVQPVKQVPTFYGTCSHKPAVARHRLKPTGCDNSTTRT